MRTRKPRNGVILAAAVVAGGLAVSPYNTTTAYAQAAPEATFLHSLESDVLNNGVWLFGGTGIRSGSTDQLWKFVPSTRTWIKITPDGKQNPKARSAHGSAYDIGQDLYVIFGGRIPKKRRGSEAVDETWHFSPTANSWSSATGCPGAGGGGGKGGKKGRGGGGSDDTASGPPAQVQAAMTYDPVGEITLFGGTSDLGGLLGDTWTLQFINDKACWTDHGTPDPSPAARTQTAMTYVASRETIVLYGGRDNTPQNFRDMWEWNGTTWSEISQIGGPGPAIRGHSLLYDAVTDSLIVFGGQRNALGDWDPSQETHFYDFRPGGGWSSVSSPVTPRRANSPAVLDLVNLEDEDDDVIILFGGTTGNITLDDTWIIPLDGSGAQCINSAGGACNLN